MARAGPGQKGLRALLGGIYRKPRNEELFDRLDELAGYSQEATRLFRQFAFGDLPLLEVKSQIEAVENQGR